MQKIVVAITGASGSIYARLLLTKLLLLKDQCSDLAVVMTENAKQVWQTELGNEDYNSLKIKFYTQQDFTAPFASGSGMAIIHVRFIDHGPSYYRTESLILYGQYSWLY